jgi:hypothetical protein
MSISWHCREEAPNRGASPKPQALQEERRKNIPCWDFLANKGRCPKKHNPNRFLLVGA